MTAPDPRIEAALRSVVGEQEFDVDRALHEVRFAASPSAAERTVVPEHRVRRQRSGAIWGVATAGLTAAVLIVGALLIPRGAPPLVAAAPTLGSDLTFVVGGRVVDRDGAAISTLSPAASDVVSWSPDGTRFVTSVDDQVIDVDTVDGASSTLASGAAPAWSPDGRVVVFESTEGLSAVDTSDGRVRPIITGSLGLPSWSPDGSALAFVDASSRAERVVVAASGTTRSVFEVAPGEHVGAPVSWAPDGRQIAVSDGQDVFLITLATGAIRPLTAGPGFESSPAWSPQGDRIAFVTGGARDVYSVSPSGRHLHLEASLEGPVTQVTWRTTRAVPVPPGLSERLVDGLAARCDCPEDQS